MQLNPGVLRLEIFSPRTVRVTFAAGGKLPDTKSFAVIARPQKTKWQLDKTADEIILRTDEIAAHVNRMTGAVSFFDKTGAPVLAENPDGGKSLGPNRAGNLDTLRSRDEFTIAPGEAFYGLGQHGGGLMNYRGAKIHLQQRNPTESAVPVLISSQGYGIFWDNPAIADVDIGKANPKILSWESEAADAVDFYFMSGPKLDDVIASYRQLTGAAPMLGEWAWGFWQCKERYQSQQELLDVAGWYRANHVPLDGVIQDWQYWTSNPWGSHLFDTNRYPDPKKMMDELHAENVHALISVWAKFDLGSANQKELARAGALYTNVIPAVFPKGTNQWYDPFNPAARKIYWRQISRELFADGFDGWWLDASEPELSGKWGEFRNYKTGAGPGAQVFNAYPLLHTTAVYQGQRCGKFGQARFHPHALGLCGTATQRRRNMERRHSRNVGGVSEANSRRPEFFHQRHSVLEHGHRRIFYRHTRHSRLHGIVHALVSIQRVLPDVPRSRHGQAERNMAL